MPLGNRLKEFRAAGGLNQQELGSLVDASRQTISLIERGDYNPSITLALKIARVFGKSVEEVFISQGRKNYESRKNKKANCHSISSGDRWLRPAGCWRRSGSGESRYQRNGVDGWI